MPNSMTAYARASCQGDWGSLSWEIRSVNHRYLEASFRLPETLRDLEMALRDKARQQLSRGKVDCLLQLKLNTEAEGISVNIERARTLVDAARTIGDLIDDPAAVSPLDILRQPGVMAEREVDTEVLKSRTLALFEQALEELNQNRAIEGDKLGQFILQRLDGVRGEVGKVRRRMPAILDAQRQRLLDRIRDLVSEPDMDRFEQEVVFIAQKADVDEELDRLEAHLSEIERVLATGGAIGRRLDFLMQELNREANTLSSKSLATDTTLSAVELKVLIEQMREQIQNVE
ncbi:MAG: YicC family protein [Porticoccaceae bacterium]|nr:YicC family protein [Porticoccaceae bacterium]